MTVDRWLNLIALLLAIMAVWKQLKQLAQQWVLRPMFALNERSRQKKRAQLEARKAFLIKLHDALDEQNGYLLQGVLIALTGATAAVVLGVNMWMNFPRGLAGYTGLCALLIYFFALYRLGVHRLVRNPASFEKAIKRIDAQIASLQTDDSRTVAGVNAGSVVE